MGQKIQFMVLAERTHVERMDALRIVLHISRADVLRQVLDGTSIKVLEQRSHPRLARLYAVATAAGQTWEQYVTDYAKLYARKTYGPTLEELELEHGIKQAEPAPETVPAQ